MKLGLATFFLFCSMISANALATVDAPRSNPYNVSIVIHETGDLKNCPGFMGWVVEKDSCVFRFNKTVSAADVRLDYTGMLGWAKASGEVSFQYYVGDIDSGVSFKFKIPTNRGNFVFGDEPYLFEIDAGDYASGLWAAKGIVTISPAP